MVGKMVVQMVVAQEATEEVPVAPGASMEVLQGEAKGAKVVEKKVLAGAAMAVVAVTDRAMWVAVVMETVAAATAKAVKAMVVEVMVEGVTARVAVATEEAT